jgi:hypothetical protein
LSGLLMPGKCIVTLKAGSRELNSAPDLKLIPPALVTPNDAPMDCQERTVSVGVLRTPPERRSA